ncbi:MAG: prenyltransferase [Bacteroidales bacterium]|nr:prenyltransferase [Bacteroidales bacterium]
MKHSFKEWFVVTRYWSFTVSTMPVLATFAFLFSKHLIPSGALPYLILVLALLGVVILHAAGNVLSDMYDYKKGVDSENAYAVPNLVFHKFEPKEYLRFSILLFAVGIIIGLVITLLSGPALLIIGGVGVVLTALYSFLKFRALGDLDIFIIFGILPVLGTTYAVTGAIVWEALILSIPIGIITVSVLHANNASDIQSDGAAGIKTFAMLIGGKASSILYCAYMIIPFACIVVYVAAKLLNPLALLSLLAFVPALKNIKQAAGYSKKGLEAMEGLDLGSAQLQLAFSGLLSVSLFVAGLIW